MYYLVKLMFMAHTCMVREKLAGVIRALLYVMVLFVEFLAVNRYKQIQGKIQKILQKDREEQGDAHELLTSSCDDSRARLVRMAVYGIREVRASERVSERVSRVVRVSTRGWLFIGQSAQLVAIKMLL